MRKSFVAGLVLSTLFIASRVACAAEIPLPADEAFRKAVLAFRNMGAMPVLTDKEGLMIKTDRSLTQLTVEECDCGSRFGKPFLTDRKTKTLVSYQVQFKRVDEKNSDMELKVTIDGYVDVYGGAPTPGENVRTDGKRLMCRSTGALEKKFEELLLK